MRTSPTKWDNRNTSPNTQKAAEQKSTARELPLKAPITKHQSPSTNHQAPITNHQAPITNHLESTRETANRQRTTTPQSPENLPRNGQLQENYPQKHQALITKH